MNDHIPRSILLTYSHIKRQNNTNLLIHWI